MFKLNLKNFLRYKTKKALKDRVVKNDVKNGVVGCGMMNTTGQLMPAYDYY